MANRPLAPIVALLALAAPSVAGALPLERIKLPPGFRIELYADRVKDARSLALGAQGVVFVGTRRAGKVYALVDSKKQNRADKVVTIASGLEMPNGVAYRDGSLFVAEISRILRYDDIERNLEDPPRPAVVRADYPDTPHHGWKYIAFGPDGLLYVVEALAGASGLYRLPPGRDPELMASGEGFVGLAFAPSGEVFVASNDTAWRVRL